MPVVPVKKSNCRPNPSGSYTNKRQSDRRALLVGSVGPMFGPQAIGMKEIQMLLQVDAPVDAARHPDYADHFSEFLVHWRVADPAAFIPDTHGDSCCPRTSRICTRHVCWLRLDPGMEFRGWPTSIPVDHRFLKSARHLLVGSNLGCSLRTINEPI